MIAEYNRKSLRLGVPGLLLQMGCTILIKMLAPKTRDHSGAPPEWVAYLLLAGTLAGVVLFIVGLCYYAKGKGYSGVLGLLGLLSCLGLLILAVLPDKTKS
jgi:hypothetical protein